MKRIFVAIGILVFVGVLCALTLNFQTKSINELIGITDQMQTAYEKNDLDQCLEISYKFVDKFKSSTRIFPFFMRHSDISKIEDTAVALPVMLETENAQHFAAELIKCRNMLENMADLETPTPENIL